MARRRRRYGGIVSLDLGRYAALNRSVVTRDVLIGIGVGLAGAAGAAYGLKRLRSMVNPIQFFAVPAGTDWMKLGVPLIGGVGAGYAAWMLRKRKNRGAAYGNLIGSIVAGIALTVWPKVAQTVGFSGVVGIDLPYGGLLVDDSTYEQQAMNGLLVDDAPMALRGYADRSGLGRLAAASLDGTEDYRELGTLARFSEGRAWAELDVEGQG